MIEIINTSNIDWLTTPFDGIYYKFMIINYKEGRILDLLKVEKGYEVKPHTHKIHQMSYLISGKAETIDGSILEAGTFLNIPAGEMHGFKAIEECIWHDFFGGGKLDINQHNGNIYMLQEDGTFVSYNG